MTSFKHKRVRLASVLNYKTKLPSFRREKQHVGHHSHRKIEWQRISPGLMNSVSHTALLALLKKERQNTLVFKVL